MPSGPEQLKDWMRRRGFTQADMARYFDWDQSFVSVLMSGRRSPGLETAITIERLAGIPVEAWLPTEVGVSAEPIAEIPAKRNHDKA